MRSFTFALALALLGAVSVSAQNSTVTLALYAFDDQHLLGSVIASDSDKTTYSLSCPTSSSHNTNNDDNNDDDDIDCGIPPDFTVTEGPSTVQYTITANPESEISEAFSDADISTSSDFPNANFAATIEVNCKLSGTTNGDCTVTNIATSRSSTTSTSTTTSLTRSEDFGFVEVTVTAKAAANPSSSGSSTNTGSGSGSGSGNAASTQSSSAGMPLITANAQWVVGGAAAALAYGAM